MRCCFRGVVRAANRNAAILRLLLVHGIAARFVDCLVAYCRKVIELTGLFRIVSGGL